MSLAAAAPHPSDDEIPYPLPVGIDRSVTLTNSISWVRELYEECGRLKKPTNRERGDAVSAAATEERRELFNDEVNSWFTFKTKMVPGDVLTLVDTITIPTPRGFHTLTRAKVDQVFDRRYLLEWEDSGTLQLYTYVELDQMRFAFLAVKELVDSGKVYTKDSQLSGLAKRDIKKNCGEKTQGSGTDSAENESVPAAAPATTSGSKQAAAVQKHVRAMLEDECQLRWPHTPVHKSCVVKLEQDPQQPRHKPLFQATVELPMFTSKASFKGQWVGNKRDAENSAAEVALRMLLAKGK